MNHTCIKDDGGTPNRRCEACIEEEATTKFDPAIAETDWMLKQSFAAPARYYGNGGTIHSTGLLNVEVDKQGKVVSVWFRCCLLPFDQTIVDTSRANEMRQAYADGKIPALTGVEILDKQ